jgi:Uma2 family endonuclease
MTLLLEPVIEKKTRRRRPLLPHTLDERMDMLKREIRVPATIDEYFALVQDVEYNIHYSRGHIVSFIEIDEQTKEPMGEVAPLHERVVARLITMLSILLDESNSEYEIYGSNVKVYADGAPRAYNPDIAVTKGVGIVKSVKPMGRVRRTKVIINPHIIVEVLSPATKDFDQTDKLADYKTLDTLEQVIFIDPYKVHTHTFIRKGANQWLNLDFHSLDDMLPIVGTEEKLSLKEVYKKIMGV